MKFQLFLNQLTASQILTESRAAKLTLDCYGNCNPYNATRISGKSAPISSLKDLYLAIKRWRIRKEAFGYLCYDPNSTRVYEADSEAMHEINRLTGVTSFKAFKKQVNVSLGSKTLINEIKAVCI